MQSKIIILADGNAIIAGDIRSVETMAPSSDVSFRTTVVLRLAENTRRRVQLESEQDAVTERDRIIALWQGLNDPFASDIRDLRYGLHTALSKDSAADVELYAKAIATLVGVGS